MLDDPSLEKQILRPPQASRIAVLATLAILCVHPASAPHVPYGLTVLTDNVHETPVHRRWLDFFGKMESWLDRYLNMSEASSR